MKGVCTLAVVVFVLSGCGGVVEGTEPQEALGQLESAETGPCYATLICHAKMGISCSGTQYCVPVPDQHLVSCDGQDTHCQCVIGQQNYNHMQPNPTNPCLICDLDRSGVQWSTNDGYSEPGTCKTSTRTCMGGPCAGNLCFSNNDCASVCSGGQFICGGGGTSPPKSSL